MRNGYIALQNIFPMKTYRRTSSQEDVMRNLSTIGLLSAAAMLSFFHARPGHFAGRPGGALIAVAATAAIR